MSRVGQLLGKWLLNVAWAALVVPALASAQSASLAERSLLSSFMAYTDLRLRSVERSLEILAATTEARSRSWESMKGLLGSYENADDGIILWYMELAVLGHPHGTYYTVDKGAMDVVLSDRSYFQALVEGRKVTGALVVSRSTDRRAAVIAVPIRRGRKVVGAIGASLFLRTLSEQIASVLALPDDAEFFALAPGGLITLHSRTGQLLLDPRKARSDSLRKAVAEMLSRDSGEVTYEVDNVTKKAIYRTSSLTGWKFAIAFDAAPKK